MFVYCQNQIIYKMQSTERKLFDSQHQEYDYWNNPQVQDHPGLFSKFLFFNRLKMLYHYISKISKQTLYRYNDNYEPMISTNKILNDFKKNSEGPTPFSIASQIFRMQKRSIITLIVLSIIVGLTSLVPIYFQFILVKAVMGNSGNFYSIAVIICVMFVRFILLNYVLNLSNNIALNAKIYMQNTFVRAVFACKKFSPSSKYFDVDLVGQALYYVPYLITSQIIIIGDIVFVFLQVGVYGCIVLGIYIVLYIFIGLCGKAALQIMRQNSGHRTQRQKFQKKSLSGLMRMALERVQDYVYQLLIVQKTLQVKENLKINLLYILGQTCGQACIVLSNITLYALTDQQGISNIYSYYSVLFMVACFFPMRYSVYGFFTIIKAYEAYQRIDFNLSNIQVSDLQSLPPSDHEHHVFAQNVGDCFQYPYQDGGQEQINKTQLKEINTQAVTRADEQNSLEVKNLNSLKQGQVLMILTRVDSRPSISELLKELIESKPNGKSLLMISSAHFILPLSLKDNILFYSPYDEVRFKKILQITQLNNLPQSLWSENNRLYDKNLKYNEWHQSRIQLARALYNDVDYLILNKQNLFDDLSLLTAVFAQRKSRKKITIVANNTHKYYFKLADRVLAIGKRGEKEIGTYNELHMRRDSLFNLIFLRHHEKVDHSARVLQQRKTLLGKLHFAHKQTKQSHLQKSTFFEFFNFVHRKAEFIILITVFLPPCFKYYLQYLIGTSVTANIFWRYLIFGLIYIFFIFLRGFVLSVYTNFSSLSLFRKICRKLNRLNAHQILQFYQKPHVDFDFHSRIIDRNLVMDFQYGQSILVQIIVSFIVYCTGQPIYIGVAIPIIIGIVFINAQYMKHARMIYLLKMKQTKEVYRLISSAVDRRQPIDKCLKADDFNKEFHKQNRIEIIYNSNIEWLETGVRTIAQLLVWLSFMIFLIIMINTVQNVSLYTSLVSLGCSMFINLMYLNTFYLKTFRQMEISLVSLTLCMSFLKEDPHPSPRQLLRVLQPQNIKFIPFVQTIQFRGVSLRFFSHLFNKINLKIESGDRLVLSGNSNTHKQLIFYILENKLFDCEQVKGDLLINGQVHRQFNIDGLFFLRSNPIIPFIGTVYDVVRYSKPSIEEHEVDKQIQEFFQVMDLVPIFKGDTEVEGFSIDQKELFEVFRVVMVKECKILVIIDGLDNIDIVSRRKLMKWLLKRKAINIVIETTNVRQMVELYPKKYAFQGQKIIQEQERGQNLKELYLKKLQTNQDHQVQRSSQTQKDEKQFDSMLRIELQKKI